MVDDEKLREWVENKLESGVDEERIRKSLRETGNDPGIVDEVKDPFASDDEFSTDETNTGEQQQTAPEAQQKDDTNTQPDPEPVEDEKGSRIPDVSAPSMPEMPSVSFKVGLPDVDPDWKKIGIFAGVLLLIGVVAGGVYFISNGLGGGITGFAPAKAPVANTNNGTCPNVGVRILDASVENGNTVAQVQVTRGEAEVILEAFKSDELVATTTQTVSGESTMQVQRQADKLELEPVGCTRFRDTYSLP